MLFLAVYEEKLSVNAATISQEHKIVAKINESLLVYNRSFGKMENDFYFLTTIYHNGHLNQFLVHSNGIVPETNEFHLVLNISTYQEDEAGEYSIISYSNILTLQLSYGCPVIFDHLVYYYSSLYRIILDVGTLQILTAGKWITIAKINNIPIQ